jgi:hypothetical protein
MPAQAGIHADPPQSMQLHHRLQPSLGAIPRCMPRLTAEQNMNILAAQYDVDQKPQPGRWASCG